MELSHGKSISKLESYIIREYQTDAGIVGEEANIGLTFHVLVTKSFRREYRLHEAIINLSGAGKSTLAEGLIKPFREFREEDIVDVVRITGPALERYDDLDGKILLLSQSVGNEPNSIRPLLSEGKLGLMITEQKEGSHKFEAKLVQKKGMPVFITTTTDPNTDPELLRRVIQRTVDESAEQTKRIKVKQALNASTIQLPKLSRFRLVKGILEQIQSENPKNIEQVIIPFARQIEANLPDDVEIRSKLPQFLNLIRSIAIVKSLCYRGYYELKAIKIPPIRIAIATIEDFNDAKYMAGEAFFHLVPATAQAILEFLSSRTEIVKDDHTGEIKEQYNLCTIRQIQEKLRLNASTIAKYANKLADQGLILKEKKTKGESKVEVNYYQYLPDTITDTNLELKDFNFRAWFDAEIIGKDFKLTYQKIDSPLELEPFNENSEPIRSEAQKDVPGIESTFEDSQIGQNRDTSDLCVNIGKTPIITHESDISHTDSKSEPKHEAHLVYPTCSGCGQKAGLSDGGVRTNAGKKYCESCYLKLKEN
jgi:hypothetical protein